MIMSLISLFLIEHIELTEDLNTEILLSLLLSVEVHFEEDKINLDD